MKRSHQVKIDGVLTTLTFDSVSGSRGYQYLTPGNTVSHAFPWSLSEQVGMSFRINGRLYEVMS